MQWIYKRFNDLTVTELYGLLQLRSKVFVVEQNCVYLDMDGKDADAIHIMGMDADGNIAAYCRLLHAGISYKEYAIGRVVTGPESRAQGAGRALMRQAIRYIEEEWGINPIRIGAQLYLKTFYESLGFAQVSDMYLEDGIPHIEMLRSPGEK